MNLSVEEKTHSKSSWTRRSICHILRPLITDMAPRQIMKDHYDVDGVIEVLRCRIKMRCWTRRTRGRNFNGKELPKEYYANTERPFQDNVKIDMRCLSCLIQLTLLLRVSVQKKKLGSMANSRSFYGLKDTMDCRPSFNKSVDWDQHRDYWL